MTKSSDSSIVYTFNHFILFCFYFYLLGKSVDLQDNYMLLIVISINNTNSNRYTVYTVYNTEYIRLIIINNRYRLAAEAYKYNGAISNISNSSYSV